MNYSIVAQSAEEVRDMSNSPSISLWPYLQQTGQEKLLRTISIYGEAGATRDQVRLLYMNAIALKIWREMGKTPTILGEMRRPSRTSVIYFGVPYSE